MNKNEINKRLEQVLKAYGADPARWPEDERDELLVALKDAQDTRAFTDARELDQLLDSAKSHEMPQGALDRLKAATKAATLYRRSAEIVALPQSTGRANQRPEYKRRDLFAAAAAIAACLMLGVFVGNSQLAQQYFQAGTVLASRNLVGWDRVNAHNPAVCVADGKIYLINFDGQVAVLSAASGEVLRVIPMDQPIVPASFWSIYEPNKR